MRKKRSLAIFAETDQLVEFYDELKDLKDAYQGFKVEGDSGSYDIGKDGGNDFLTKVKDAIDECEKAAIKFIEGRLEKIDKSILSNNFDQTIKLM